MVSDGFVQGHLVATLSKKEVLKTLRQWRYDSNSPEEADILTDLIHSVEEGELDG